MQNNPLLAAALLPPNGDETPGEAPGGRVVREIRRRRRAARCSDDKQDRTENIKGRDEERPSSISWPEFVGVFVPLGKWGPEGGQTSGEEAERRSSSRAQEEKLDGEELQLLRVAFAMVVARGCEDGTVSLAELRAASAELDGEEPPEEPVRKALTVRDAHSKGRRQGYSCRACLGCWLTDHVSPNNRASQ